jgi:hypothetical protein
VTYETHVKPFLEDVRKLRESGMKNKDLMQHLGISSRSWYSWVKEHEDFKAVMSEATLDLHQAMESLAESSLYAKLKDRTVEYETVVVFDEGVSVDEDGVESMVPVKRRTTTTRRFIPADTTALIFALKNRAPVNWNNNEHALTQARVQKIQQELREQGETMDINAQVRAGLARYHQQDKED